MPHTGRAFAAIRQDSVSTHATFSFRFTRPPETPGRFRASLSGRRRVLKHQSILFWDTGIPEYQYATAMRTSIPECPRSCWSPPSYLGRPHIASREYRLSGFGIPEYRDTGIPGRDLPPSCSGVSAGIKLLRGAAITYELLFPLSAASFINSPLAFWRWARIILTAASLSRRTMASSILR
jgi:hypothetical protein